jgi:hypothetical protein
VRGSGWASRHWRTSCRSKAECGPDQTGESWQKLVEQLLAFVEAAMRGVESHSGDGEEREDQRQRDGSAQSPQQRGVSDLLAACRRNDIVHTQILNHLSIVIERVRYRCYAEPQPGRHHVEQRVLYR